MGMARYTTTSPRQTREVASALTRELPDRCVLALVGDLGSGKTCFVKGVADALGVRQPVTSPTFTIVNEYSGTRRLAHIDLYRISSPDEALALGLDEYIDGEGITAVEWPDRAGDLLAVEQTVRVTLAVGDDPEERTICIDWP